MQLEKEELITTIIQLQNKVMKDSNVIQSLCLHRDWIIDKKLQLMELLGLMDTLTDAGQAAERTIP